MNDFEAIGKNILNHNKDSKFLSRFFKTHIFRCFVDEHYKK